MRLLPRSLALAVPLILGCGSDAPLSPTVGGVAGTYTATSFTATNSTGAADLLAAGSSVNAVLKADGTTSGHLLVPAAVAGGVAVDEDLTGTWTLSGTTVSFSQSADTFLRDLVFTVSGTKLVGDGVFSGTTLHIVLTRS